MINKIRNNTFVQRILKLTENNFQITMGAVFLVGMLTGWLVIGWWLFPVEWTDAEPESLHTHFISEWVQMSADSYVLTTDIETADERIGWLGEQSFGYIENARSNAIGAEQLRIAQLQSVLKRSEESKVIGSETGSEMERTGTEIVVTEKEFETEDTGSGLFNRSVFVAVFGGFIMAAIMSGVGYYFVKNVSLRPKRELEITSQNIDNGPAIDDEDESSAITQTITDTEDAERGPPLARYMTTFLLGDDLYDDSFGIDDANGDFLGECGMGISDTIGVGEPKKVCAFEIWLFDKNDVRTVTKVLMSEDAFGDESKRAYLAPKGEPLMADSGKAIVLETASLYVSTRIVDLQYGGGALPQNSFFNQLTLELSAWRKV